MFIFRFILLFLVTVNVAKSDSKSCKRYCWNIQTWKKCKIREISLKWVNTNFLNGIRSELEIEKNYISSVVHYECASHKQCTKSRFRIVNDTDLTTSEQIYIELMDNNRKSACAIFPVYGDTSVDSVGDHNSSHYYFIPLQEFYNPIIGVQDVGSNIEYLAGFCSLFYLCINFWCDNMASCKYKTTFPNILFFTMFFHSLIYEILFILCGFFLRDKHFFFKASCLSTINRHTLF